MLLTCGHFWLLKNTVNTEYSRLGVKKKKKKKSVLNKYPQVGPVKRIKTGQITKRLLLRGQFYISLKKKVKKFQPPEILEKCKSKLQ